MKKETILNFFSRIAPTIEAEAHCDIPCGIYDPTPAKIAAKTIQRMVIQIKELPPPRDWNDAHERLAYFNAVSRRIAVKESHTKTCEAELVTLWADFFKAEHFTKDPGLHERFWNALQLCSKNTQNVDEKLAGELIAAVDEIAKIFYDVKKEPEKYGAYKKITDTLF